MIIAFARQGQEIGQFSEDDVPALVASGEILPSDDYWHEGMTEWLKVSGKWPPQEEKSSASPKPFEPAAPIVERRDKLPAARGSGPSPLLWLVSILIIAGGVYWFLYRPSLSQTPRKALQPPEQIAPPVVTEPSAATATPTPVPIEPPTTAPAATPELPSSPESPAAPQPAPDSGPAPAPPAPDPPVTPAQTPVPTESPAPPAPEPPVTPAQTPTVSPIPAPIGSPTPAPKPSPEQTPSLTPTDPQQASKSLCLTELTPVDVLLYGDLMINKYNGLLRILVDRKRCDRYIFAHAPSRLVYKIPSGFRQFTAVGIKPSGDRNIKGDWIYIVRTDGEEVFRSGRLADDPSGQIKVSASLPPGAQTLELIVEDLQSNYADHSIWAYPTLK